VYNVLYKTEMSMRKARYGVDAPSVIAIFFILAGFYFFIAWACNYFMQESYPWFGTFFLWLFSISGIWWLVTAALMLRTSLHSKYLVAEKVVEGLELKGDESILDAGCGRGLYLITIAKKLTSGKAVGIDIWKNIDQTSNSLKNTLKNCSLEGVEDRVEVMTADMREIPFDDGIFNVVMSAMAVHNIKKNDERRKALNELARVLKPGGTLIILDFRFNREYLQVLKDLGWQDVELSEKNYQMMPPVRVLKGVKPQ